MIIGCTNCHKKFDIEASLIPEKGRLLQCSSCNHKWFFINELIPEFIEPIKDESLKIFINDDINQKKKLDLDKDTNKDDETAPHTNKKINERPIYRDKKKKKYNLIKLNIVFIISLIALIIMIDTFKTPIRKIVPNIDSLLSNLFESCKDLILFIKDLI